MPPKRGRGKPSASPRKHGTEGRSQDVPDVYQQMLVDAVSSSPSMFSSEDRPLKKRRVGGRFVTTENAESSATGGPTPPDKNAAVDDGSRIGSEDPVARPTIYKDSDDPDESDGSDMDWEEVDINPNAEPSTPADERKDLTLVLGGSDDDPKQSRSQRRRTITGAERTTRLEIHKMHVMGLLAHAHLRNHWCNDETVQDTLGKLLSKAKRSFLEDDDSHTQFRRSQRLIDGLAQASEAFRASFNIDARGLARSYWAENEDELVEFEIPNDVDLPMQKEDFRESALKMTASRDVGAQLFCAMLRSVGVETRLVCSLQPLPLSNAIKNIALPKPKPAITVACPETRTGMGAQSGEGPSDDLARTEALDKKSHTTNVTRSKIISRLGRVSPSPSRGPRKPSTAAEPVKLPKKRIRESLYPVYWVEAFNTAHQRWVSVDPLVTKTIAKSSKFEPPTNDPGNVLSYVVAFEEDGSARDVTRRYAKAYNAKTRKLRVESTKGGGKWLKRVMRFYKRAYSLDRDQVEDAELTSREASEPMPKNIADFKDHPYYALERHLRRNEVIHPRRETGKVSVGKAAGGDPVLEPIFRRNDVHLVKSEDSWYRLGRIVKHDEEPLKQVRPRGKKDPLFDEDAEEGMEEHPGVPLYAGFQTCAYEAPPIVNGRIPKNVYKNLDIYVSSMIPPGGVHIAHPDTARAARILGIDYADAVTGFEFKGRTGTAVVKGAVVAGEFHEAVCEVIRGLEYERDEAELEKRSLLALKMWKRFVTGLRIKQRIDGYEIEGERDTIPQSRDAEEENEEAEVDNSDKESSLGGGFERGANEMGSYPVEDSAKTVLHEHHPIISTWGKPLPQPIQRKIPDSPSKESDAFPSQSISLDDFETGAGGFFVEDDDKVDDADDATPETRAAFDESRQTHASGPPASSAKSTSQETDQAPSVEVGAQARGISAATAELEDARVLQELHEARVQQDEEGTGSGAAGAGRARVVREGRVGKEVNGAEGDGERGGRDGGGRLVEGRGEVRDESDKGSLLSHDPEDEDADPEWIL